MNMQRLMRRTTRILAEHGPLDEVALHKRLQDEGVYITSKALKRLLYRMEEHGVARHGLPEPEMGLSARAKQDREAGEGHAAAKIKQLLAEDGYTGQGLDMAARLTLDMMELLRTNGPMEREAVIDDLEAAGWHRDYLEAEVPRLADLAVDRPSGRRVKVDVGSVHRVQHAYLATQEATDTLGGMEGVQRVADELGGVLATANALDDRRVNVAFFDRNGQRLLAVSRLDPTGKAVQTEISLLGENYGGFARCLAQRVLRQILHEDPEAASGFAVVDAGSDCAFVGILSLFQIVSLSARIVEAGEER